MFDRRLVLNFDWPLFAICLIMSILGIINLYSAGSFSLRHSTTPYYLKQLYWLLIGLGLLAVTVSIDYQLMARHAYLIHGLSVFLLVLALFWGRSAAGTHRWLQIGGFSFQPSELAKITLVLLLSRYFSNLTISKSYGLQDFAYPILVTIITFVLIFLEPDLGTAALLVLVFISFVFFLHLGLRYIVVFLVSGAALLPVAWQFLEEYQKRRVFAFLSPGKYSLQAGYQAIQSKIAVGSGMFFGKGFLCGTQSQLRFLPEQHTDFVFSVVAEEWGFVGSLLVVLLFFLTISRGLRIASQSRDRLGSLVAAGLVLVILWQVLINVGMVTGLFPIVGIPLPFLSYGGSSLVTTWVIIGILLNIRMRKFMF
jgi:rod shape determining protein RodA